MKVRRLEQAEHGLTRPLYEEVFSEDSKRFIDLCGRRGWRNPGNAASESV